MADRPLRPATRRCLGEPLPHQLADRPRDPPRAPEHFFTRPCDHVKASGISRRFQRLSRSLGQVSHVLLTRSPLSPGASSGISFDLHVLGTPPAFVLSQDQTLRRDLGHPEGLPRSVLRHSQTPEGVRVGDHAYVERNRRWLQQFASPAGVTRRFVARPEGLTTGSPTPLSGSAFELTEDCRASRNARHLPHSLLRPSLPFSRSNRHESVGHAVRSANRRCLLLARRSGLSAAAWGELLRYRPHQSVSTLFRQVFPTMSERPQ